ncbi:hypothetical protein AUEXF2481DRAFT_37759 [Aureobasidium subglaciale EXF-2481]|uniref:VanZ-like domain-containing protein n=1 Tax=Aureobasidium subglaciale (strain EXF-2481) TaxID=1043005 RepID=A0A074YHE7_AURSE|nr:uncharacterized protein AUEXF2481DRAFT_37759 [Aureobasidium subglaciale EXF-2481]KEQ97228.1 hypothetical protein AUEXF2481DRAFT_37759 [Aureobasidium subglaciale EXF-2481]
MRIRKPFAAAFVVLLFIAASLGLAPNQLPQYKQSDKVLHFVTFFLITFCFYWIIETNRRRVIHFTLVACTVALSIGSEVVQGLLPNGREFDPYDILANVVGSLLALLACSWYHKRMLERRRAARNYQIVPGEEQDIELGDNTTDQENGVLPSSEQPANITEELDNWDENAEDWDDDQAPASSQIQADQEGVTAEKRSD